VLYISIYQIYLILSIYDIVLVVNKNKTKKQETIYIIYSKEKIILLPHFLSKIYIFQLLYMCIMCVEVRLYEIR